MRANAPKSTTLLIALLLAIVGVAAFFITIPCVTQYAFYILLAGFVVLLAGNLLKGL